MEITFRKAKLDDIDAILPLMYSAAEKMFEFSYTVSGKKVKDFLKYVLSQEKGYYGVQNQIVGVHNNEVVFSATVYAGKDITRETIEIFALTFAFYGIIGSIPVIKRSIELSKVFKAPKKDSFYIGNVGTNPELRGKGIATQFFNHIHELAKKKGIKRCELDVSFENPNAERLYTKLGYQIVKEYPYTGKENLTGMKRMEIIL